MLVPVELGVISLKERLYRSCGGGGGCGEEGIHDVPIEMLSLKRLISMDQYTLYIMAHGN